LKGVVGKCSYNLCYNALLVPVTENTTAPPAEEGLKTIMASASVKGPEQLSVDVATGAYRVVSTMIKLQTDGREELYNLSQTVRDFVKTSGITVGLVVISSLHTTCAIFINEWQEALVHDVKAYLSSLINKESYYRHNDPAWSDCDRHNADSHLRSLLLGMNLTLQIADGDVVLGEWQSVIMAELDGPRERTIRIQAMGI
jgi:secondary thiamine-phosphate synthase enzyme